MEGKQLVVANDGGGGGKYVAYKTENFPLRRECYVSNNGCNVHNPSVITIIVNVIRNKLITLQFFLAVLLHLPYLIVIQ